MSVVLSVARRTVLPLTAVFVMMILCLVSMPLDARAQGFGSLGSSGVKVDRSSGADRQPDQDLTFSPVKSNTIQLGVAGPSDWSYISDREAERTMDLIASIGSYVRFDVEWHQIEEQRGRFDWSRVDRLVKMAEDRDLSIVGVLTGTPSWARARDGASWDIRTRPRNPQEFANFAYAAADRYSGRVEAWEVWNEPNSPMFWNQRANIGQYVELLKATYPSIKDADRSAVVISGGLAAQKTGGGWIGHREFVDGMYDRGANRYFDALGMHIYTFPALPNEAGTESWNPWIHMRTDIRDRMVAGGDFRKPIWVTEAGAPTGNGRHASDEQRQGELITALVDAVAELDYVGPILIYSARDRGTNSYELEENFGLVRTNWSLKSSYHAVRQLGAGTR